MSIQFWNGSTISAKAKSTSTGKPVRKMTDSLIDDNLGGALQAGSTHVLAIEVTGDANELIGVRGPAWISYHPRSCRPASISRAPGMLPRTISIFLRPSSPESSIGTAARRTFKIDDSQAFAHGGCSRAGRNPFPARADHQRTLREDTSPSFPKPRGRENLNVTPGSKFEFRTYELIPLTGGKGGN